MDQNFLENLLGELRIAETIDYVAIFRKLSANSSGTLQEIFWKLEENAPATPSTSLIEDSIEDIKEAQASLSNLQNSLANVEDLVDAAIKKLGTCCQNDA